MFCKNCGKELKENVKFCIGCGKEIVSNNIIENVDVDMDYLQDTVVMEDEIEINTTAPANAKEGKILTFLWSALICVFIFAFIVSTSFIVAFKLSITNSNVEKAVKSIDFESIIDESNEAQEIMGNFTPEEASEIIRTTSVGDYISDYAIKSISDIKNGVKPAAIPSEDIIELMNDNYDEISEITGYDLQKADYDKIEKYFDENGDVLAESFINDNMLWALVKFFMSDIFVLSLYLIILLLFVLLFVVRCWKSSTFLWIGVTGILSSLSVIVLGLMKSVIKNNIPVSIITIAESFIRTACLNMIFTGLITVAVSAFFVVLHIIIRKFKSKRQ